MFSAQLDGILNQQLSGKTSSPHRRRREKSAFADVTETTETAFSKPTKSAFSMPIEVKEKSCPESTFDTKQFFNQMKPCAVPDCGEKLSRHSYCHTHVETDHEKPICSKSECDIQSFLGGYCAQHYIDQDFEIVKDDPTEGKSSDFLTKGEENQTIWQHLVTKEGQDYYFNTETNETSWEKPEELMTPEELDQKGDWYWVPDEKECYVPGRLIASRSKKSKMQLADGTDVVVKTSEILPLQRSSLQRVPDDLVLLDKMSTPLILHCLRKRFEKHKIYTAVGTILISINPYQMLPLYTPQIIKRYKSRGVSEDLPPHVYNIAHDAFYGVSQFKENMSIIISGESGAGKTEATKQCLTYLTNLAGTVSGVEKKVLQANPILEAFGNAKTIRNDNSSRFGKYMEIFFDQQWRINSASTRNYLLEKIRVCSQTKNERNYHIFYMLTKASSKSQRADFFLSKPTDYYYLRGCIDVSTLDDHSDFDIVQMAFQTLKFSSQEINSCFKLVSTVLTLGNIKFEGEQAKLSSNSKKWVDVVCKLLQVEADALRRALLIRELRVRGTVTDVALTSQGARENCNALAKFMYSDMFDWLVRKINLQMEPGKNHAGKTIGMLDIFGFEIFGHNTFEQLCINFTNEMLQQQFNHVTFKLEEAVYKAEKINFKHIEFIDNQPMLDLISKKPNGILPLLDEELVMPKGSDKTFIQKIHLKHSKNAVYGKVVKDPTCFIVIHYAGKVTYHSTGFLEKNRDSLTSDLLELLQTSAAPLIQELFPASKKVTTKDKKSSLGYQFQGQLRKLMNSLNKTEPHYIRCIKPNGDKSAISFVPRDCLEQLTYSGVFEAVAIRKQGFPFRLTHPKFQERYCCVCDDYEGVKGKDSLEACRDIIKEVRLNESNVQIGVTRVLYRADEYKKLELVRSIKIKKIEVVENINRLSKIDGESLPYDDQEPFFLKLAAAVREADKFRLKSGAADRARERLERWVENRMDPDIKLRLEKAYAVKHRGELEAMLDLCTEKGYRTKLIVKCKDLLARIVEIDACLMVAKMRQEQKILEKAVRLCADFQYDASLLKECQILFKKVSKVRVMLKKAAKSLDHGELDKVLKACASFGYMTQEVQQCKDMLQAVLRVRKHLKQAKKSANRKQLQNVVDECDKMGYKNDLVTLCRKLIKRIDTIERECKRAKQSWNNKYIRACVLAADEIKYKSDTVESLRKLLTTSRDALLKKQYKKALKKKNHKKAITIAVKRKDIEILRAGAKYSIKNYKYLKDPLVWGGEKFWGDKRKRAANMLCWQQETIHSPLTDIAKFQDNPARVKLISQKILFAFETIQKFMGQRKADQLGADVYELFRTALTVPEMRNDIYLCIMKQMYKNPQYEAVPKGWQLLALCLTVFNPSDDFENYLEAFIRSDKKMSSRHFCRGLLRERAHHGSVTPEEVPRFYRGFDVQSILDKRTRSYIRKTEDNEEITMTSKNDSYGGLAKSFYPGGYSKELLEKLRKLEEANRG